MKKTQRTTELTNETTKNKIMNTNVCLLIKMKIPKKNQENEMKKKRFLFEAN